MFFILNSSKNGMSAHQKKLDIISNNMVNVQTTGYKKLDSTFKDLYYSDLKSISNPTTDKDAIIGNGVMHSGVTRSSIQGSLQNTEVNTDVAIDGNGYFRVLRPNGEFAYTRSGAFNIDTFGRLSDKDGNLIEIQYEEGINTLNTGLTATNMIISKEGQVSTSDGTVIGKINLYDTVSSDGFISVGDNLFIPANENVEIIGGDGDLYQKHLEMSNVDVGQEMSEMILAQRAYQMATKGVSTADEMWSMLNNIR